MKLTFVAF